MELQMCEIVLTFLARKNLLVMVEEGEVVNRHSLSCGRNHTFVFVNAIQCLQSIFLEYLSRRN